MHNEYDAHAGLKAGRHTRAESLAALYEKRAAEYERSERRAKWLVRGCVVLITLIMFYSYAPVFI